MMKVGMLRTAADFYEGLGLQTCSRACGYSNPHIQTPKPQTPATPAVMMQALQIQDLGILDLKPQSARS